MRRHGFTISQSTFLVWHTPWDWYFRIRGWGFSLRITRDDWQTFSERYGYIKVHRWGPVRWQVLRNDDRFKRHHHTTERAA